MKSRVSKKIFPFAPGVAWEIVNGKYVVPKIDAGMWNAALQNRNPVILAHGGLLETFYSLAAIEAIGTNEPSKALFWAGNPRFNSLVKNHGKATVIEVPDIGSRYPTPIFMDASDRVFFNVLNNYRFRRSYQGTHSVEDKAPVCEQIFRNVMLPWDRRYLPDVEMPSVEDWARSSRFHANKRFILVIPHPTGQSTCKADCLPWEARHLREFIALLHRFDVQVVICTDSRTTFYDLPCLQAPRSLDVILALIAKASVVLASDIDFLFVAMGMSKATIVAPADCSADEFDLYGNADFLGVENVIFTTSDPSPLEIATFCEGIL